MNRRTLIKHFASAPLVNSMFPGNLLRAGDSANAQYRLATFSADITPPFGSALCGGWIKPAQAVDDALQARGIVLIGGEKPIVLCSLDWVENNNATYDAWRAALAEAAGTDSQHVAVHCVHPHNTPWADIDADRLIQSMDDTLKVVNSRFVQIAIHHVAEALRTSLGKTKPITHLGTGEGQVEQVASNRRIRQADGTLAMRMSKSRDLAMQEAPEGLIDPMLKTVSFWNEDVPIAALHYYAVHPMSFYGDGRITSDFCGLARNQRQAEQPGVFQIYFTGCAGDIAAGKYNDGSPEMRLVLRDRVHAGMVAAWQATRREPITKLEWSVTDVRFPLREEEEFSEAYLKRIVADQAAKTQHRLKSAVILSWLARRQRPVELSCLRMGNTRIMHLPGEPFIHYQLFAQEGQDSNFVCVAAYGDGGMGYIPLAESFTEGGYEPTMAFIAPASEQVLKDGLQKLLAT